MKKTLFIIFTYIVLAYTIYFLFCRVTTLQNELGDSILNVKAYSSENSQLKESNLMFKLSLDQMEYYNDSLMVVMKRVANDNGIKDKNIKSLQYQLEHYKKIDTITLVDTIFIQPDFMLDTCVIDQWNKSCIHLAYPSTISISNEYKNDKYIILDAHKEPIKPRKWFLTKWLSKKHTIVEVTVIDENPYVETKQQRFIEILK